MSLPLSKIPSNVKETFLKMGGEVEFYPLFTKKRTFKLNRTKLQIVERKGGFTQNVHQICLPSTDDFINTYEFEYHVEVECEYFLLKVISGNAFKINGVWSRQAYIFENDEIIIGHNKIRIPSINLKASCDDNEIYNIHRDLTVLIEGETGTGKTSFARKVHESRKLAGDFVHLNIASMPASLIESELFGHVKGAFTGAISDKEGAFKNASYGTLFIDEIDSLPLEVQTKLLLFLDHKKVRPVGSNIEIQCYPHLIFASGQPLETLVSRGKMRKDFYYRLSSEYKIEMKALRHDRNKIKSYCEEFEYHHNVIIPKDLLSFYYQLNWPGNFRQLQGHLKKKMLISKNRRFSLDDFDLKLIYDIKNENEETLSFKKFKTLKKEYFLAAYYRYSQNLNVTAKALGVSSATIRSVLDLRSEN